MAWGNCPPRPFVKQGILVPGANLALGLCKLRIFAKRG